MDRITASDLATMLLKAPVWAKLALTAPDTRLQARAADTLAARIIAELNDEPCFDHRQIALPL